MHQCALTLACLSRLSFQFFLTTVNLMLNNRDLQDLVVQSSSYMLFCNATHSLVKSQIRKLKIFPEK